MFDARGRRNVRSDSLVLGPDGLVLGPDGLVFGSDGLVLGYGTANGRDLLVLVLLFVRVVRAVFKVRVGYGLRVMVHGSSGRGCRVYVARGRQSGPKRFRRYVYRVVQRRALLRFRTEVRFAPTFFAADEKPYIIH